MIRIVGVQRGDSPDTEFVLLQNQGMRRLNIRGHVVADESLFGEGSSPADPKLYAFGQDVSIPPSNYVALFTGCGQDHWGRSVDGSPIYFVYWGRLSCAWGENALERVHLMQVTSSYAPPREVIHRTAAAV